MLAGLALPRRWRLAAPVEGPLETVVFEAGDTIRGVAERYLKDPDLWPQILELSGVGSPAELRPGAELKVPVQQVAAADEALAFSLAAIQKATAEGARIFAPDEIGSAIENRDTAVERRDVGDWAEVVSYSGIAAEFAEPGAGDLDRPARPGGGGGGLGRPGQRRGPGAGRSRAGRARAAEDVLVEFERLRTLSSSTAQVTFRDLSRLRLNPNSNAIIQRDAQRPADRRRGDQGQPGRRRLLRAPEPARRPHRLRGRGAGARDRRPSRPTSGSSTRAASSRFANYDAPALEITRGGETISLGENEGAVVPAAGAAERAEVLARAELEAPFDGEPIYDAAVTLSWQPGRRRRGLLARGGGGRRLQRDAGLGVGRARHRAHRSTALAPGEHFWRVSSLDRLGLPGRAQPEPALPRSSTTTRRPS